MSLELLLYLAGLADSLRDACGAILILLIFFLVPIGISFVAAGDGALSKDTPVRLVKAWLITGAVCAVVFVLTPAKSTIHAIAAVSLSKEAAQSEVGQALLKAAEEWAKSLVPAPKK